MTLTKEQLQKRYDNVSKSKTFSNLLKEFDLKNKKVLDIGCSSGEFLYHFGPGSTGLTINDSEVENGKTMGVDVRLGNIEETDFGADFEKKFDVVFANNIYEHMLAPHLFLIKIKHYLKDDGVLILGVPAVPYLFPLIYLKQFAGSLSPAHVNFFNRYTLRKSVEYAGWNVLQNSGFYFRNRILDFLFNYVCPHFYVIAKIDKNHKYGHKRMVELAGYKNTKII